MSSKGSIEHILIYVTASSIEEAKKLGRLAVEKRLAACANIIPGMVSCYHWEGEICESQEVILLLKSQKSFYKELEELILANHSYEVPCVVELEIKRGSAAYLAWIDATLQSEKS